MSVNVQQRGTKYQVRVKHKLLPKPYFCTFDTEGEADTYGHQMQALLESGVVPSELLAAPPKGDDPLLDQVISEYLKLAPVTDSDDALLALVRGEVPGLRVSGITFKWAESYVAGLKLQRKPPAAPLAPSSIRKRVGLLGRVLDWHIRRNTPPEKTPAANVMRLLPRGYSLYTKHEAAKLAAKDIEAPEDVVRDRRLLPGEPERVAATLAGEKRDDRERALEPDPEFTMLYELIVDTGMRLFEAYRVNVAEVDLARGIIQVQGSKGHRGIIKPRTVPIKKALREKLRAYMAGRKGRLFSFWDGTPEDRKRCTSRLSNRFTTLFSYAKVPNFTEHDLRHEATCRWVELRDSRGAWVFSDTEICRIMGWKDTRMMLRYASLRGEDLAARLVDLGH